MLINYVSRHTGGDGYSHYDKDKQAVHPCENQASPLLPSPASCNGWPLSEREGMLYLHCPTSRHQTHVAPEVASPKWDVLQMKNRHQILKA